MLGKRPCLLRATSSRSLLIPCDDAEGEPASFCSYAQVTEQSPSPALSSPCKIVIGFDIGTEKKRTTDVCESPRSVLDPLVLLPLQEKQQIVAKSPRSGLGSLLTASSGSGDKVAHMQSKEVDVHAHMDSVARSSKTTLVLQNCLHQVSLAYNPGNMETSYVRPSYGHTKGTGWPPRASNSDLMDADLSPCQRQAPFVFLQEGIEDEFLDADISPRQVGATCVHLSQDMKYNFNNVNINSPSQSRGFLVGPSKGLKDDCMDANIPPQESQARRVLHPPSMCVDNDTHISARECGASHVTHSKGVVDDCIMDHIFTSQSEAPCVHLCMDNCIDAYTTPWQRQGLHYVSLDINDCKEISVHQSIFSAASPPSYPHSLVPSAGFLNACAFCGHSLRLGKDIFMYRGDQAFCSAECRYQKIALDESKEKLGR